MTTEAVSGSATAVAHPSLAMIKYWGKQDTTENIPATPSLAVTLDGLDTTTHVVLYPSEASGSPSDIVKIDGVSQPIQRYKGFFDAFRRLASENGIDLTRWWFMAESSSNFPSAAGLASSASGFAALVLACAGASGLGDVPDTRDLSAVARVGSASAARSLWGGFTQLNAGAKSAAPVKDASWWPNLRIIVAEVEKGPKSISSRMAMESTRLHSPYYKAWLEDSSILFRQAMAGLESRDLSILGPAIRKSYMRMFATMFASDPPIVYWKPGSLSLINACEKIRGDGIQAWETMDAGPQVKVFCLDENTEAISRRLQMALPGVNLRICTVGGAPVLRNG
ncbi:MAG: diphosphomevalonate decarboxylase [Spirochaetaceae bacterium]|nr:diphosphomevalonate decarboxylase [Spirochaetaceae bacterium]